MEQPIRRFHDAIVPAVQKTFRDAKLGVNTTVNFIGPNDGGMGGWLQSRIAANEFDGNALTGAIPPGLGALRHLVALPEAEVGKNFSLSLSLRTCACAHFHSLVRVSLMRYQKYPQCDVSVVSVVGARKIKGPELYT